MYQFPPGGGVQRPEQAALTGIQDQTGRLSLTRDSNGNLLLANSPSGFQLKFEYDDQNRITKVCASNGLQFDYQYDPGGHLSRVAGGGQVTEYRYEGDSALSIFHNGSMILHNDYDAGGRVIRLVLPDGIRMRSTTHSDLTTRLRP